MKEIMSERVAMIVLMVLLFLAIAWGFSVGTDKSFKNQDAMLCESAKESGNIEWLNKCDKYYQTGNINDLGE